jgi:saxitoxin biosynthesis operon SxtJ-like protein
MRSDAAARTKQMETMAVFALVFLFLGIRFQCQWFLYASMVSLLIALFIPSLARFITLGWEKFSRLLGTVNNRIILTMIFCFVLTPLAWAYRLFNRDSLQLVKKMSGSYYHERNHRYSGSDLEKMW